MATLSDIAKRAGVSNMTVSKVLRGEIKGVRSDAVERAKRIRKIADELGYRPNAAARQMRSQRFGAAAVLSRRTIGLFHFNMVKGVMRGLAEHNMHLIQAEIDFARAVDPSDAPRIMRELCVDGVIVDDATDIDPDLMDQLTDLGVPAVFVNTSGGHDCVDPNDEDAAERLARRVLEAGHHRVGFTGDFGPDSIKRHHYSALMRHRGCCRVLGEAGIEPALVKAKSICSIEDAQLVLAEHRDITAWILDSERDAHRFFIAAQRMGIDVPGDLSLATFANVESSEDDAVRMTAMLNPMIDVGIETARMLVKKITDPTQRLPVRLVPWREAEGETLAPPRNRDP